MKIWSRPVLCLLTTLLAFSSHAEEIIGTLDVQLVIVNGCAINGGSVSSTNPNMGQLNFGSTSTLSQNIDSEAISATSSIIQIQCTAQLPYSVLVGAGLYDDTGVQRRISNGAEFISYNLYQDASRSIPWDKTVSVAKIATGAQENLAIYGRVPPQITPSAGTYTDTVQITVSW